MIQNENRRVSGFFSSSGSLENVKSFLLAIGNPHLELEDIILITGTTGKTQTAKHIINILASAGHSVNAVLSGHFFNIKERIILQNKPIEYNILAEKISDIQSISREFSLHTTFFETMLLVGIMLFPLHRSDVIIIEAGIGDKDDPTNVFKSCNILSNVITTIDVDHEHRLGGTLELNAIHHACAIKSSVSVVSGDQKAGAMNILKEVTLIQSNKLVGMQENYWLDHYSDAEDGFSFSTEVEYFDLPSIKKFYEPERKNISTAIMTVLENQYKFNKITSGIINNALESTEQQDVFEITNPLLASLLNKDSEIIFIPANNAAGARFVASIIKKRNLKDLYPKTNYGIFISEIDTNGIKMLEVLKSMFAKIIAMDFGDKDLFLDKDMLCKTASSRGIVLDKASSLEDALSKIVAHKNYSSRVIIFGSPTIGTKIQRYLSLPKEELPSFSQKDKGSNF